MSALTIDEMFTPATAAQWLAQILANAATLELPVTSWQPGDPTRTILTVDAQIHAQQDAVVSAMAQGGFLDFAASGSVTYVGPDGVAVTTPVTPDPSIPSQNPTGTPGWLDVIASSQFDVQREGAEPASGFMAIANASLGTYGPFAPGTHHVANAATGATYSNEATLTIVPGVTVGGAVVAASNTTPIQVTTTTPHGLISGAVVQTAGIGGNSTANGIFQVSVVSATQFTLVGSAGSAPFTSGGTVLPCQTAAFSADIAGPSGTSAAKTITQAVTSTQEVTVSNYLDFVGAPWESNTALAARCRLKLQSVSTNGPKGAYDFFARSAFVLLAALTPPFTMTAPITKTVTQSSTVTGVVSTFVANDAGPVSGCVQNPIVTATFATPIAVTTANNHGLSTGSPVIVTGVLGNTAANGTWTVTVTSPTSFTLNGSAGNAAYGSGGSVEGGDLGGVDYVIQSNCVPSAVTEVTASAGTFSVTVAATVLVPQAQVASYTAAVQTALALYFKSLPIGGAIGGAVQYNDVIGALYAAGALTGQQSYVLSIPSVTLNGVPGNLSFPSSTAVATLVAATITVVGT